MLHILTCACCRCRTTAPTQRTAATRCFSPTLASTLLPGTAEAAATTAWHDSLGERLMMTSGWCAVMGSSANLLSLPLKCDMVMGCTLHQPPHRNYCTLHVGMLKHT